MRCDEDSYRTLVDHLPDGFARLKVVVGADGKPVDCVFLETNPAFETLTGLRREQILERRVTEAVPGIERSAFDWIGTCGRVALDGGGVCCEQYAEPLGRWYEATAFSDRPGEFAVVFHDITERRRQRSELDRELARRRLLQDQSRDGIVVLDGNGSAVETNLAFARMLGYSPEEVLQLHVWDWDVPTPREKLEEMIRDVDESGAFFETQHRRKDGSIYDVEVSTNAAVFAGQKRIFCVCRDITERKRSDSALRVSEERLAQLARHSRAVAWEVDLDGLFTYVSPVVEEVLGLRPDDLVGRRYFYETPPEEAREEVKERALRAMQAGADITDFETPMVSRDGRILWVAISGIPLKDTDGRLVGYRGWVVDITARKTAELTLRASEERFRSLFENSLDAIFIGKPDGTVIDVNQAWLDLFGYTREDLATLKAVDVYAEPGARDDFLKRIAEAGYVRDALRLKKKDGTLFDCERSVMALQDQSGTLVAYQGVQRDVTERERARRELLESASKYRALFEHSMDAISLVSPGGLLLEANEAYLDLFGYTREDIGRLNVEDQYVDHEARTALLEWMATHDSASDQEVRLRRRDGTVMDCLRNAVVRRDSDGNVIGEQSVIRDVTEHKKVEDALRRSEAYNRSIVEVIPDLIIRVNTEGELLDIVASADAELAVPRDEAAGKRIADILSQDDAVRAQKAIEEALRTDSLQTMEYQLQLPSGKRWFEARYLPSGRTEVVALIRDITERRQAEQELRASEQRFRTLFEQSMDAIYVVDYDGSNIRANPAWLRLFGYTLDELPQHNIIELYVNPDDRRNLLVAVAHAGAVEDEVRFKKKDGTEFQCARSVTAQRDEEGSIVAFQGIMRDVTEQKRARAELERLARIDTVTGLLNRRIMLEKLMEWLRHVRRYNGHLSVVMLDLDHFKQVNDLYGHQVGDH
ncbi:MAG: PAS domain S-box protein, partial [Dehalococcoidia bacterium]|nr:PAS domain S-box protein [Dehalococcoidia bacterium]